MGLKLFGTGLEMPILMIGPKILPFLAVFLFSPFWAQHALADLDDEVSDPVSRDGTSTAPAPSRGDGRGARPYSETGPRELQAYLREGITPNYIRIDVRGYNIRRSPDFSTDRSSNIDFKTKGGELFAVESVKRLQYGAAVQVHVDGELRWVYVPYGRKNDFQFCESEACFTAMARSLDFLLRGTGVSVDQAQNCGVSSGPEGLILPAGASVPRTEPDRVTLTRVAAEPSRSATSLAARPLWENSRGAKGEQWTQMLSSALETHGQKLLNQRSLSDASTFCPRYSSLDREQRKEFWIHLFNGIARYESNFKLGVPVFDEERYINVYRGPIRPNTYSMGLFQLSYSSAPGYRPGCRIDYSKDRGKDISDPSLTIYDPQIQMECAVTIMSRWVPKDGGVGLRSDRGGARFWSTLRSSNSATQNVIASMRRFRACW